MKRRGNALPQLAPQILELDGKHINDVKRPSTSPDTLEKARRELSVAARYLERPSGNSETKFSQNLVSERSVLSKKIEVDEPRPIEKTHGPRPHVRPPIICFEIRWNRAPRSGAHASLL